MIGFALLLFPFLLLGFVLLMGRVEEPLTQIAEERDIEQFLDDANADELDAFVREGTDSALSRFRSRLGLGGCAADGARADDSTVLRGRSGLALDSRPDCDEARTDERSRSIRGRDSAQSRAVPGRRP